MPYTQPVRFKKVRNGFALFAVCPGFGIVCGDKFFFGNRLQAS
jgi:hypothetical protein